MVSQLPFLIVQFLGPVYKIKLTRRYNEPNFCGPVVGKAPTPNGCLCPYDRPAPVLTEL